MYKIQSRFGKQKCHCRASEFSWFITLSPLQNVTFERRDFPPLPVLPPIYYYYYFIIIFFS